MTAIDATAPGMRVDFALLLAANAVLATALTMTMVLGGLAGLVLAPTEGLATLPTAVSMLAGLFAAAPFSLLMGRHGRRAGFVLGAAFAAAGGVAGLAALVQGSFALLLTGHVLVGAALACFQFFRFAAAEVAAPRWRSVAISLMLTSGLVAAVAGPAVFARTQDAMAPVPLAGGYAAIVALAALGVLPLLFVGGPAAAPAPRDAAAPRLDLRAVLRRRDVAVAILAAAIAQGVMILLMVPTPIVMVGCGFAAATAATAVGWHVVAMFAPSFATGFLIMRLGARAVVALGLALLAVAALIAAAGLTLTHFYASLIVLGVGWNLAFVGATSLLADALDPQERAAVQGINDTAVALAAAVAAFASGALVAGPGWTALALAALPVVAATALALAWFGRGARTA